ncbi:MAG: allantoinase AllB [Pyrinomonadaceae bacterium]|nr:allantoinase AllB [Pyrinomonadaceae bacterium]
MPPPQLIIRGQRVVLPDSLSPASVHVHDGRIAGISSYDDVTANCEIVEAGETSIVMPGLVDTHVHINEPGRTDWEGFATATRAAAAGGVTTLVDMPLNSIPPTTTAAGLRSKVEAACGQCSVDVGFWGGVVPGNTGELAALTEAGVVGFKCFLIHSGVDEFPNVTEADLRRAMPELARLGAVLIVHAEVPGPIDQAGVPDCHAPGQGRSADGDFYPSAYKTFLESRPREAENEAVALMIKLGREFGTRIHIVHHSSADALPMLREARAAGVSITAETCPHYLVFTAEEISNGATEFKCCPPIRERENREQLWQALAEGTIDMVVSDHSPCPPDMKLRESGDFLKAWGGISSLQLRLPATWTAAQRRGHSIEDLARWLCQAPATLVGLADRKGAIRVGSDADIVIWHPEREFVVGPDMLHHRHKLTPYAGRTLAGVVEKTFLRGEKIYDAGEFAPEPIGLLLRVGAL